MHKHGIQTIVAHSLGSAVAGQWVQDHPDWVGRARLYNWPRIGGAHTDQRIASFSDHLDPISIGDRGASRVFALNPHSYDPHGFT